MAFIICIIIWLVIITLFNLDRKYKNPYKLYMYFGKKGCGKTTHICKTAMKYQRKGNFNIYTTEFIPDTFHIDYRDIGEIQFPRGSVLLVDEVGMIWDNRDFKKFSKSVRDFFKLQRHYGVTVYLYSQCFDIDKKLRDLCDELYIMKSYFNCISVCKKIRKDLTIVEAFGEAESRITDDLKLVPFIVPGSRSFTYLPKYHKYFDSYAAPELRPAVYKPEPVHFNKLHKKVQKSLKKMKFREKLARIHAAALTFLYKKGYIFILEKIFRRKKVC